MKKRLIALVLALTMLADSPGMLYASQLEPSTEYSSREEETDSGVTMKEITSDVQPAAETGDMTEPQESQDFVFDNGTITGYTGTSSEIVIPEEIDGIPVTGKPWKRSSMPWNMRFFGRNQGKAVRSATAIKKCWMDWSEDEKSS